MGKFYTVSMTFFVTINMLAFGVQCEECEEWLKRKGKSDKIKCNKNPGITVITILIVYLNIKYVIITTTSHNIINFLFYFHIELKLQQNLEHVSRLK